MKFQHPFSSLYVPDGASSADAFDRCSSLGIGAHQDDLEFMALHGVLSGLRSVTRSFGGVTCTDGAGSARTGPFADTSSSHMREIRKDEQNQAARIGGYSFMAQLGYPSREVQVKKRAVPLIEDLERLLRAVRPGLVYTHNPADKHPTHIGVVLSVVEAVRRLDPEERPGKMLGCEGWRNLDWMADEEKVVLDVSGEDDLAARLGECFASQIQGGKRYDLAVEGRRRANATFFNSHTVDQMEKASYAMDLTPLVKEDHLDPAEFTLEMIDRFRSDVSQKLRRYRS